MPRPSNQDLSVEKTLQFPALSKLLKTASSSRFRRQRCQRPQRLLKVLHSHDRKVFRIASRLKSVVPGRNEEDVHTRFACAERFLLHSADRTDRAVESELAGRGDCLPVGDVAAELLQDVEREGEAR